jgi:serine/threonine-protein kinase
VPAAPRERPLPTVEGYETLCELGRGGMGVVYRARQILLNRPCVLKMILAGAHADAETVARFLVEAEAVARLQHPNVVQIRHIGEAEGLPFFELEYVDGGSLDKRLDGTPWKAGQAAEFVEALARGVAEAHRLGIVHRDLKPANILMTAEGAPKITDFGLAKSLTKDAGLTRSDSIMGSPGYMAPEQAQGRTKEVGPPADVYALGAILYEILTGRPPFTGATVLETLEQVRTIEPVAPSRLVPRLPRDVETIALKCLHKDPARRYGSAVALAEDLRRFLDGKTILARPVGPIERGWRWCRRNTVVAGLAAALTTIMLAATAASLIAYQHMSRLARGEHAARLVAVQEMKAAEEAHERAETNFNRARAAVDDYLTRISESQLLKVPGLLPLRGELLESALRFYQDFLRERGDDPTLRAELAATQARIGRIQMELGAADEARRALKSAIATYEAEIPKNPQNFTLRTALADAWLALGDLDFNFGEKNLARDMLAAWEKNAELREGLARSRPDDLDFQRDLADAYGRLGLAHENAGRDGMTANLRGAEIRLALYLKSPDDPKHNFGLAESMNNIAVALTRSGRHEDALAMYLRGQEYNRFAYDKLPHMIDYGSDLGTSYMNVVRAYRKVGRSQEAIAEARKAVEHCRGMVRDHPAATIAKRQFVWALEALVESQHDAGRAVEAARTGRELEQWLDIVVDEPRWVFDGACWHARLSVWADERKNSLPTQELDEAHREADRAVEQLRQAIEAGFADLDAIQSNQALDPLRGRADFQKLVANLEERLKARPQGAPVAARPGDRPTPAPGERAERVFQARADRAAVLHAVGVVQTGRGRRDAGRAALAEARALCERLLEERPSDARLRALLAATREDPGRTD